MGMPQRGVHAPSNLIVTSLAFDLPPELFGDFPSGCRLHAARRFQIKRMFAPPGQTLVATSSSSRSMEST
jgi:hypothetical protein